MAEYLSTTKKKITAPLYFEMKQNGEKISWLTAYDYTTASIIDAGGVDTILVGDSASNVADGNMTTLPITVDQMIYHARSVARAVNHALVVCDMPFGSYQVSAEEGLRNAIRIMKEAGVDAVKIEGGAEIAPMVKRMVDAGIPVSGHLGLQHKVCTSLVDMVCVPRAMPRQKSLLQTPRHLTRLDVSVLY